MYTEYDSLRLVRRFFSPATAFFFDADLSTTFLDATLGGMVRDGGWVLGWGERERENAGEGRTWRGFVQETGGG